jgi:hypothetical protein
MMFDKREYARQWRKKNRDKVREQDRQYYAANKETQRGRKRQEYHKNHKRYKRYEMTLEQFNEMIQDQNYKCLICKKDITNNCHIDHCHQTKKIRGLLCQLCNRGLGYFKDNPVSLLAAHNYLTGART